MPDRHLTMQRRMSAAPADVWELFADFPNLAGHWKGIRGSRAIGSQASGVGARRHVSLKPLGGMDETVTVWEEGRRIDTENVASVAVPFSHAESTLLLKADGYETVATFDYRYTPRGGPLGAVTGPLIDRMLIATFKDMLAAIEDEARPH